MWRLGERSLSLVRIWDAEGPVGCGFFVGGSHIMTCAHVVGDALGDRARYARSVAPTERIGLDFVVHPAKEQRPTHFAAVVPEGWCPEETGEGVRDVAVLQLVEPTRPPPQVVAVLASPITLTRDAFSAWGIKAHQLEGSWVEGKITDVVIGGELEVVSRHPDQAIREGCSGGAAWNVKRGGIVGMVAALQGARKGRIIPVDQLRMVWPIADLVGHSLDTARAPSTSSHISPRLGALLYRCDRHYQASQFDVAMDKFWRQDHGVVICAIAGLHVDLPSLCRDRCLHVKVKEHLEALRIGRVPVITSIRWPGTSTRDPQQDLRQQVKSAVGARSTDAPHIRDAINKGTSPWAFSVSLKKRLFGGADLAALVRWICFWREVSAGSLNKPVVVFLMVDLEGDASNAFSLDSLCGDSFPGEHSAFLTLLEPLGEFPLDDVKSWLEDASLRVDISEHVLNERLLPSLWSRFTHRDAQLRLAQVDEWLRELNL